jgi:3-hydroxybutyryl-CoA dehydratase
MAYFIEDLKPGMSESYTKTVTGHDIALFGEASGDKNPVHFDEAYAKTTPFKRIVARGREIAITEGRKTTHISYISAVLGNKMPGPGTIFLSLTTRFKAPVHIGDTVTTVCTVRETVLEKRRAIFDCACRVGDKIVIEGEAVVMVPSRSVP